MFDSVRVRDVMWYILYFTGQRGHRFQRLAVRLEALSSQVQRLSRERDNTQLTQNHLNLLLQGYSALTPHPAEKAVSWWTFSCIELLHVFLSSSFRQNQQSLAQLVEKELRRVSQQLDKLIRLHHHEPHRPSPRGELNLHTGEALILCLLKNNFNGWGQSIWIAL